MGEFHPQIDTGVAGVSDARIASLQTVSTALDVASGVVELEVSALVDGKQTAAMVLFGAMPPWSDATVARLTTVLREQIVDALFSARAYADSLSS